MTLMPHAICAQSIYHLVVVATEVEDSRLTSTALINVYVDDINDNPPVFVRPAQHSMVDHAVMKCADEDSVNDTGSNSITLPTVTVHYSAAIGSVITRVCSSCRLCSFLRSYELGCLVIE
jgi:hypothetical protein